MSEETDAPQGGAEGETTSEAVETISEATTEQETGTDEPGLADDTGEATEEGEAPAKRVPWFQKRIDEVTAKKYDAEREAAYWRGIAEGRAPAQEAPVRQEAAPDRWEDPEGYDQWLIDQAVTKFQATQQQSTILSTYEERATQFRESKPDFDSVVNNPSLRVTPTMADVIRESDVGPQVAYHLGTNPAESARIASLPLHRQAAELGKLEVKLTSQPIPAATAKPIPPSPPQTVGAVSAGLSKPLEDMSMAEYIAARSKEQQ
jgi:hypothetical protein